MTNPNRTHLALVLDRSGSMRQNAKAAEAEAGVRRLLDEQRQLPGELHVTIVRFDDQFERISGVPAEHVTPEMLSLEPRGMTALYDALGRTIGDLGSKLASQDEDERPGKVIVIIATDGMENASVEYTAQTLGPVITEQREKYGWEFVFLGTSQEQMLAAQGLGVAQHSTIAAADTGFGLRSAYAGTSSAIGRFRAGAQSVSFTEEERIAAAKGDDA